jgi:competence protein ComEC
MNPFVFRPCRRWAARAIFLWPLILTLAFATRMPAADPGKLTVTWLDLPVHGLAVVMETPSGKVFLIDTGGVQQKDNADYTAGRDTIAPFLTARGHREIAGISISHPHGDHYGGASWLLNNWKVGTFLDNGYEGRGQSPSYTQLRKMAQQRGAEYRVVHNGDRLEWDPALSVEVLSPPAEFISLDSDPAKVSDHGLLNSNSIVLRVQHGKNVFLFPGDSYGGAYEEHLQRAVAAEKLKTTVLSAPHHGFNPGIRFPQMTQPKIVVASCLADYPGNAGTPNPRSPGERATKVFGELGAKVYVTAWHGNVEVVSDGETVKTTTQRDARPAPAP